MTTDTKNLDCPIITIDGPYFYRRQERFIARGLVYQTYFSSKNRNDYLDPLDDRRHSKLLVDTAVFKEMNVNALWVSHFDPNASHTESMRLLAKLGIYVIFRQDDARISARFSNPNYLYNEDRLNKLAKVIDCVACYPNTLGVCVASEANLHPNDGSVVSFRNFRHAYGSLVRDLKRYMRYKNHDTGQRIVPLCINEAQWSDRFDSTFEYVAPLDVKDRPAGGRVDFYTFVHYDVHRDLYNNAKWGLLRPWDVTNIHIDRTPTSLPNACPSWTDQLPMEKLTSIADPVPMLISEYGTVVERPRDFDEVRQLYGNGLDSPLLKTLSGGFIYEYTEGLSQNGLVGRRADGRLMMLMDFWNLRSVMHDALGLPAQPVVDTTDLPPELQDALAEASRVTVNSVPT